MQAGKSQSALIHLGAIILAIAGLGIFCLIEAIIDIVRGAGYARFVFAFFQIAFGGLCLLAAYRNWPSRTVRSLRSLCTLAGLVVWWLLFVAAEALCRKLTGGSILIDPTATDQPDFKTSLLRAAFGLMPVIMAMLSYRLALAWLLPRLELVDHRSPQERISSIKLSLGVMVFFIFSDGGQISHQAWQQHGHQNYGPDLWEMLTDLGPIILAVAVYKIGGYIATRHILSPRLIISAIPTGHVAAGD